MMTMGCHRACRWGLAFLLTLAVGIAAYAWLIPSVVGRYLRHELAERGFPGASLRVRSVGLDHVKLADVQLAEGVALGDVELDAGLSLLWRPARALTLRGAHLSREAAERWAGSAGGAAGDPIARLPIEALKLVDCTFDLGPTRFAVSGSIGLRTPAVDLRATTPAWHLGPLALRQVAVTARSEAGAIRACVAAEVTTTAVEACTSLPATNPLATRAFEVAWSAAARGEHAWQARGRGRVTRIGEAARLTGGTLELSAPATRLGGVQVSTLRTTATFSGELTAARELTVEVPALELAARTAARDGLQLGDVTIASAGSARMTASRDVRIDVSALALSARTVARDGLQLGDVKLRGVLAGQLPRSRDVRIDVPRLELTAGTVALDELRVGRLKITAAGAGVLAGGEVRVERSTFALAADTAAMRKLGLGAVTVDGALTGTPARLAITGTARAGRATVRGPHATQLATLAMPFGILVRARGALSLAATRPVVVTAERATLVVDEAPLRARDAVVSLRPKGPLPLGSLGEPAPRIPWRASSFAWRDLTFASPSGTLSPAAPADVQHVAWKRIDGAGPLAVGEGFADFREIGGASRVIAGEVHVLGGTLAVAAPQSPSGELVLDVRGLSLPRVLAAARTHVEATGVLDGTVVVASGDEGCSLHRLSLWARGPGVLRVRDPQLRAEWAAAGKRELSARVHGALADFGYSSLAFMVAPPGNGRGPEVQLATHGTGRLIKQSLDLVINLRGARAAAQKLVRRASR